MAIGVGVVRKKNGTTTPLLAKKLATMTGWAKVVQQFPSGPSTRGTCPDGSSGFSSSQCGKHRRVKIVNVFFQLCNSLYLTLFFSVSRLSLVVISSHSNRKTETRTNVRSARYFISHCMCVITVNIPMRPSRHINPDHLMQKIRVHQEFAAPAHTSNDKKGA